MKNMLVLFLMPFTALANDFYVKEELADMVNDVVQTTQFKINIPTMRAKYIHIDQIDGLDVCAPEARPKVMQLQNAFSKHPKLFQTKSIHGVYVRKANGQLSFTPLKLPMKKKSECELVTVSVK